MRTRTTNRTVEAPTADFSNPPGSAAYFEPDSIQWRIYKNPVALGVGGICAVLLEFADPRIRSGVWDHSTYKVDPIGRSQRTGLAAMVGVYGPRETADRMIAGITKMHARVNGATPDGREYRALEPELLNWVAATASFGFLKAYDTFVTPLSEEDKHAFWNGGEELGALYGVTRSPASEAEFLDMMEELAPGFEAHEINSEFLSIVENTDAAGNTPRFIRRAVTRGAVSLLPPVVRTSLELGPEHDLTGLDRLTLKALGRLADRKFDPQSPPAQASVRLGLPANLLWRKASERQELLHAWRSGRQQVGVGAADAAPAQAVG